MVPVDLQPVESQPQLQLHQRWPPIFIGDIVHYVLDTPHQSDVQGLTAYGKDAHRPAIIVAVRTTATQIIAQLQVFTDNTNDGPGYANGMVWRTSVPYHAHPHLPGTFHLTTDCSE